MNQRELADAVVALDPEKNRAVTNQTISNWERGVNEPSARYKEALAKAMTVDVGYFIAEPAKAATPDLSRKGSETPNSDQRLEEILQSLAELHVKVNRLTTLLPGIEDFLPDDEDDSDPGPEASR